MNDELLRIENLVVRYHTDDGIAKAVNGLDLVIRKGTTVALVGETGAGKTTTALSVMNLIPRPQGRIEAGRITLDGLSILERSDREMERIRGKVVSMIFQDPMTALNPVLSVGDQIAEVLAIHQGYSRKESWAAARRMLETVGIDGSRADEYPHQFSGGMKQRVGIAMALACNPKLLIADEPTTALDVTIQAQVLKLFAEVRERFQLAMVFITHDLRVAGEMCDHIAVMQRGQVVEYGPSAEVLRNPQHEYTRRLIDAIPRLNAHQD